MDDDVLDDLYEELGRIIAELAIRIFRDYLDEHGEDLLTAVKAQLYEGIRDAAREELEAVIKNNLLLIQTALGGVVQDVRRPAPRTKT